MSNARFVLICLALFALGGVLRYQSGWLAPLRQTETLAPSAAAEEPAKQIALPPGLRETVLEFYERLDRGNYKEAFQISLESRWIERGPDTYAHAGLTSQDDFVAALTEEWSPHGADLNIISMDLIGAVQLSPEHWEPSRREQASSERPELYALHSLPSGTRVEEIYQVHIGGSLMERCSPWDWNKKLLVARLSGTDGWRVLLPGIPPSVSTLRTTRLQVWFLDQNPFAKLRILLEG